MADVLRVTPFRRVWLASSAARFGDWLGLLALTGLAASLASDSYAAQNYAIAGVLLLRLLPALVIAPLAGALADRLDRRRLLAGADLVRCGLVVSVALVGTLPWLLVAVLLLEIATLVWFPARQAAVSNLVAPQRLEQANQATVASTLLVAPVAALTFASIALVSRALNVRFPQFAVDSVDLALFAAAGAYVVAAVLFAGVRQIRRRTPAEPVQSVMGAILTGWRYVAASSMVRGVLVGVVGFSGAAGVVLIMARTYALDLGAGAAGYGLLFGSVFLGLGIGTVFGPTVLLSLSRRRLFGTAVMTGGVVLALVAVAQDLVLAVVLMTVVGGCAGLAAVTGVTLLGTEVADDVRGRVYSLLQGLARVALATAVAVAPLVAGVVGRNSIDLSGFVVEVNGTAVALFITGVLLVGVGAAAYGQMDDRHGVPLWSDLWHAMLGRVSVEQSAGTFIAFEGGEGAGKSTQARLLAEWLESQDVDVVLTREPGDTSIGGSIRTMLLEVAEEDMGAKTEALLYAADRAEHVQQLVRPALDQGQVVITDRYVDSSIAYQGVGRGLGAAEIERISGWATERLQPDLTVLLDVAPSTGRSRLTAPEDRLEREPNEFHDSVRQAFLDLAEKAPQRYLVLDASLPPQRLAGRIQGRVQRLLGLPDVLPPDEPDSPPPPAGGQDGGSSDREWSDEAPRSEVSQ